MARVDGAPIERARGVLALIRTRGRMDRQRAEVRVAGELHATARDTANFVRQALSEAGRRTWRRCGGRRG